MSTIWGNTDGCADKYCCENELYLLLMLAHAYNITIDRGVGAPVHGREVYYGLNATYKWLISMLMKTVQLPGAADYVSHMTINTSTAKTDIVLARECQKIFQTQHEHMAYWIRAST